MQKALLAKGYRQHDGDHHYFFFFHNNRKTSIRTKVSHGIREYGGSLLGKVRQQMKLVGRELDQYFDCDMSTQQYGDLLTKRGNIR